MWRVREALVNNRLIRETTVEMGLVKRVQQVRAAESPQGMLERIHLKEADSALCSAHCQKGPTTTKFRRSKREWKTRVGLKK